MRPSHGIGFTSFYSPGLLPGHTFAVNDAGLVQAINHIRPHDQTAGIPRHFIARAVLGSADLDAALSVLSRRDRASGFHHNLGNALEKSGDLTGAIAAFQRANELEPEDSEAQFEAAVLLRYTGDVPGYQAACQKMFQDFSESNDQLDVVRLLLAHVLFPERAF